MAPYLVDNEYSRWKTPEDFNHQAARKDFGNPEVLSEWVREREWVSQLVSPGPLRASSFNTLFSCRTRKSATA